MRRLPEQFTAAPAARDQAPLPARVPWPCAPLAPPPPLAARTSPRPRERISTRATSIFVLVVLALVPPFAPLRAADVPASESPRAVDDANSPRVLRRRRSNRLDRLRHYPRGPFDVALRAPSTRGVRVLRLRDSTVDEVSSPSLRGELSTRPRSARPVPRPRSARVRVPRGRGGARGWRVFRRPRTRVLGGGVVRVPRVEGGGRDVAAKAVSDGSRDDLGGARTAASGGRARGSRGRAESWTRAWEWDTSWRARRSTSVARTAGRCRVGRPSRGTAGRRGGVVATRDAGGCRRARRARLLRVRGRTRGRRVALRTARRAPHRAETQCRRPLGTPGVDRQERR